MHENIEICTCLHLADIGDKTQNLKDKLVQGYLLIAHNNFIGIAGFWLFWPHKDVFETAADRFSQCVASTG